MKALIILAVGILLTVLFFFISIVPDVYLRLTLLASSSMGISQLLVHQLDFDSDHELDERHDFD